MNDYVLFALLFLIPGLGGLYGGIWNRQIGTGCPCYTTKATRLTAGIGGACFTLYSLVLLVASL